MFAEVILPLPLYSSFTYSVPVEMEHEIRSGSRVLVQFGKRKFYTGIVTATHTTAPVNYEVKPIACLLDATPIVRFPQFKLWDWISAYYLCSPGEVFKAALPTGLKPESETYISLPKDFEYPDLHSLTERQAIIIQALSSEGKLKLSELETLTALNNVTQTIAGMMEAGMVEIAESVVEKYRPKVERMIRITIPPEDHESLHKFFELVNRSPKQEKTLISYLDLSKWLTSEKALPVSRDALMKISGATPGILKSMQDKGIFESYKRSVNRFAGEFPVQNQLPDLTDIQKRAFSEILESFSSHNISLLHGVTGSGKTEIYSHLTKRVLEDGNQVLYLVPEISLTTQLTDRLRAIFGDRLIIYHSKFSDNERVDVWKKLLYTNEPYLILGVRSSVFLPFARLGLVIVDEEHESSYKQYDPAPRYNGRDTAIMLASMHGAKTLLGSATPSVETFYKAKSGKYGLITLTERFEGATLPDVCIVDMKDERKRKLNSGIISSQLKLATDQALANEKQAIMFQNRRGFAPFVVCRTCGWTPRCVNCDVSLVYHKHSGLLKCHYCGYSMPLPSLCPACEENTVISYGYGTERIAEEVHEIFPDNGISRMDLDTTRNKDAYQEIIEEFSQKHTNILVGTQMITKGLDFGKVTVVGVLNADSLLTFPDFRSNERAFNMLEQVAGRAGRRADKGNVFIQTTDPSNPILEFVKNHDYIGFYENEIETRRKFNYPPFCRIINIYLKNKDAQKVDEAAILFTKALRNTFGNRILGPEKPFVSRVATYYLQQIMVKVETSASMNKVKAILRAIYTSIARDQRMKSTMIYYDVDPV